MSIKFMLGLTTGAAVGYAIARTVEAIGLKIPLKYALNPRYWDGPVANMVNTARAEALPVTYIPPPLTPEQTKQLIDFPGALLPSIKPRGMMGGLGDYPYPSMPMWANGQVDIRRNLRRFR